MYLSKIVLLFSLALLASCGKSTPPAPNETVESLAANPERLKELRQQCKTDGSVRISVCEAVESVTQS